MIKNYLKSFLFPEYCAGCGEEDTLLCQKCYSSLPLASCKCSALAYSAIVKKIILRMKFQKESRYAHLLARFCIDKINKDVHLKRFIEHAFITYVPMFWMKENTRGFNQSEIIAKDISKEFNIGEGKFFHALKRNRYGSTQSSLRRVARFKNIGELFSIKKSVNIKGKDILLVDDIRTTGATLSAAAAELKKAGAKQVLILTAIQD